MLRVIAHVSRVEWSALGMHHNQENPFLSQTINFLEYSTNMRLPIAPIIGRVTNSESAGSK